MRAVASPPIPPLVDLGIRISCPNGTPRVRASNKEDGDYAGSATFDIVKEVGGTEYTLGYFNVRFMRSRRVPGTYYATDVSNFESNRVDPDNPTARPRRITTSDFAEDIKPLLVEEWLKYVSGSILASAAGGGFSKPAKTEGTLKTKSKAKAKKTAPVMEEISIVAEE